MPIISIMLTLAVFVFAAWLWRNRRIEADTYLRAALSHKLGTFPQAVTMDEPLGKELAEFLSVRLQKDMGLVVRINPQSTAREVVAIIQKLIDLDIRK